MERSCLKRKKGNLIKRNENFFFLSFRREVPRKLTLIMMFVGATRFFGSSKGPKFIKSFKFVSIENY